MKSGEDRGNSGSYRCAWTVMGGASADGNVEWKETVPPRPPTPLLFGNEEQPGSGPRTGRGVEWPAHSRAPAARRSAYKELGADESGFNVEGDSKP